MCFAAQMLCMCCNKEFLVYYAAYKKFFCHVFSEIFNWLELTSYKSDGV